MRHVPGWLDTSIRNLTYRLTLPEDKREKLDDAVVRLMDNGITDEDKDKIYNEIDELLNSTEISPMSSTKAIQEAARKGFYNEM